MSHGWAGADPVSSPDPADYELGAELRAVVDVTLTGVRVWGGADATALANRRGRIWDAASGVLLGSAALPTNLPLGWSSYDLDVPVSRTAGQGWVVSYSAVGGYGVINDAFLTAPVPSADGAVEFMRAADSLVGNGRFNLTPGGYPTIAAGNDTFYGIDTEYDTDTGNTRPVFSGIHTAVSNLTVSVTGQVTDAETLAGASYTVAWGDGTTSSGSVATFSHTYAQAGTYAVLMTATDSGGLTGYYAVPVTPVEPAGDLPPNSELVAVAWLKGVDGVPTGKVATTLPADEDAWRTTGFVRMGGVVGGNPDADIPERMPVVQVECWAVAPGSRKPPWGQAFALAAAIVSDTYVSAGRRSVALPTGYGPADVQTATALTEPRRVGDDAGSFARVQFDLRLAWVARPS